MKSLRSALLAGFGIAMAGWACTQPASAQYYAGPGYGYERRHGDGYDRRGYGSDRDRRGWRDERPGRGYGDYGYRSRNPMAGMSIEDQKRAIKNEREAQKKAFKRGLFR